MARLVWPALVVLLILAVAGPCLTFYLLIKDYWAEVTTLRRDLLFCQLGSTELPPLSFDLDFDLEASSTPPLQELPPELPPAPLPLVATTSSTKTTTTTTTSTSSSSSSSTILPTTSSTTQSSQDTKESEVPLMSADIPARDAPSSPANKEQLMTGPGRGRTYLGLQEAKGRVEGLRGGETRSRAETIRRLWLSPTRPPRVQGTTSMLADESNSLTVTDSTVSDKEYVALLERQLRDLRARVNACRSCLTPPQRQLATCGGGTAWREYRRRDRLLRRKQRVQRKERRRLERMRINETSTTEPSGSFSSSTTTTTTKLPVEVTTTSEVPQQADVAFSWRSDADQNRDNHRARETHRMSTDFRRGFNQKISRMDEALMQFAETQAAFCKELRDNLGSRLKKRGQELVALSNQIAALVRTSTSQITALEKVASDQLYSGQTSIEKTLALTQAIRDSQLRAINNYHKQTFLPAAAAIASMLSEQASTATSMGVQLITKVEMLQDVYVTYATQQADTLQKLTQDVDMFASKHNNLVMRSKDHANHLHINTETFVRELQTRMNNVVKELVLIRLQSQNFVSLNNDTFNDITDSLNQTQVAVQDLSDGLRNRLDDAKEREQDFRKTFKMETNQISDRVESGISQALVSNHASMSQVEDAELDTRVFVGTATAAWNELYMNQEAELRKEADALSNSLRSHNHHTQNVLAGMRSAAETHEQVLEEQRMDFQRFIRKRQDALDNQCSAITDWAMLMSSELRRRDEDLHRFLSEDLQFATVTVHEAADGYLVSRLPDGTQVYSSSAAHTSAARSPPNKHDGFLG